MFWQCLPYMATSLRRGETLYEFIIFAISQLLVNLVETIKNSKKAWREESGRQILIKRKFHSPLVSVGNHVNK